MLNNFWYHLLGAVSGSLGRKVPLVDDVLSSHEQNIYPTTSLEENCMEFKFQPYRNYYVCFRHMYLVLKLEFVKGRGYETYNTKQEKKEHKDESNKLMKQGKHRKRRKENLLQFLSLLM